MTTYVEKSPRNDLRTFLAEFLASHFDLIHTLSDLFLNVRNMELYNRDVFFSNGVLESFYLYKGNVLGA